DVSLLRGEHCDGVPTAAEAATPPAGPHRHKLLAAQQLIVLGELLVERVLNTQPFTTHPPHP
ncbi:DUF6124 family protein, partial [Pseudomonas sp. NPDC078863]|uniref:DUF6124 family protein n=1 Tax=Pseudomonas sp. NPDC078863 TaxID=3364425 RepID=UPI0037C5611D